MSKNRNSIPVPELAEAFPDLNEREFRLLGFCVYCGNFPVNLWTQTMYDGKFGLPRNRTGSDRKALHEKGYLHENTPDPANYFRVAVPLIRHYPQWAHDFEEISKYRTDERAYLWNLAKVLAVNNTASIAGLRYPSTGDTWKFLIPLVRDGEHAFILGGLPRNAACKILESILLDALLDEKLSPDTLLTVRDLARSWVELPWSILDRADAYEYYLTGKVPGGDDPAPTMWTLGIRAVDTLIRGNLPDAMELFQKATKLVPPGPCDGVFPDRLLTWFYTLALLRDRRKYHSQRDERLIGELAKSNGFRFIISHAPTQTLLTHVDSSDKKCPDNVKDELRQFLQKDRTAMGRRFAAMVARYFRLDDTVVGELGLADVGLSPLPILRNEMAALLPATSAEKQHLSDMFGGPAVVGTVPRKENWEMALSDLSEFVTSTQEETSMEKRIIYFVDEKWITAIIEQCRETGSDTWTRERLLSRNALLRGEYDSMDVTDLKLARAIASKVVDRPDIEVLVPIMAGTDRVFTGQHYRQPYTPLPIVNEAPFIAFNGKGGTIEASSNVRRLENGVIPPVSVYRNAGKYTCVRTNPIQRDVLGKILSIGSFPATAMQGIRQTIDSLKDIIEVRSSLAGTAIIPTLRGSTRLDLRITPLPDDDQGYGMEISAAPYEDGDLRCEPGKGAMDVYDDTGGEPRFIRRDLQAEFDNYSELRSYLEDEVHLEFEDDCRCSIYASESLLAILTWAYDHRDKCFVEWPEGRALRFRGDVKSGDVDITVKSDIKWFAVEGEVLIGKDKYNLVEILKAMRASEVKGFIKLGDRDYVRMTQTLQRHLEAIDDMMSEHIGRNRVVPIYRVGQLAQTLGEEGGLRGTMDEGFKNLLERMQKAYDSTPEVPSTLKAQLRDYQKEGYVWMKRLDAWGAGACLADDMGLGKTVQSLAFILSKASEGPSLVVAPKSVVPNWDIETARFTPTLKVTVLNDVNHREDCIAAAGPGELILATYGVLGTESKLLAGKEWNVVCLDEAHQIKNRNTKVSAAAMELNARSRIILTGTPLQNHLGELWNLFQFINPGLLGDWVRFKYRYLSGELDEGNREMLRDLVQPFILRRTKEEVLDELPEKIIYEQMVELSPEEMQVYEATRKYVEDRISEKAGGSKKGKKKAGDEPGAQIDFLAELTRLRLAACSTALIYDDWQLGSSKTEALLALLDQISAVPGNNVLVFSQFTSYLAEVKAMLDRRKIRYLYMDGQTELDERRTLVDQFQNGDCPLFIASLKAGGLGLNLTAANYVIILDPWWNPAIENQAMDRAHRIGQKRTVTVIRLIARHTIEEKILRLHETKQNLSDEMLDGTAYSGKLTMDDVLEMVSPFR